MNYVVATLLDRIQTETAYSTLEQDGIPKNQINIVGPGFKSIDEFAFLDPNQAARKRAKLMSFWLVPFGFIGGVAFNLSTQFQLVPTVGILGNQIIGGLLGAIGGAMGSFFVGGGSALTLGDRETSSYRKQLKAGRYLIVVSGTPNFTNRATRILKQMNPETIQSFIEPDSTL